MLIDELQPGEEPVAFQSYATDDRFSVFEDAIIQAVAWANEIPPEILRLAFTKNYSASQAAVNEFKMYLNRARTAFGSDVCQPCYEDWLLSSVLSKSIQAPQLLAAWRDPAQIVTYGAWVFSEWAGQIKPAVDLSKLVRGYDDMVASGYMTRDRAARELSGMKFSDNAKRLRIENEQLRIAREALGENKSSSASNSGAVEAIDQEDYANEEDDERRTA